MIIDCFPYFNEEEILELRLNLLYDHVDKFVITEGDHTHRGDPKPFTAKAAIKRFGIPLDKIEIVEVNMLPKSLEDNPWKRENQQRNAAKKFIGEEDFAIVSDCDEIINPNYLKYYCMVAEANPEKVLRIPLAYLCVKAKYRVFNQYGNPVKWNAPFICSKHHVEHITLSDIRESHARNLNNIPYDDLFTYDNGVIEDAGWHFSWMGDYDRIKEKESFFLHDDEYNVIDNYIPSLDSTDPLGRIDHILKEYALENLPDVIYKLPKVKSLLL